MMAVKHAKIAIMDQKKTGVCACMCMCMRICVCVCVCVFALKTMCVYVNTTCIRGKTQKHAIEAM